MQAVFWPIYFFDLPHKIRMARTIFSKRVQIVRPVEMRPRIGFATGCDIGMPDNVENREGAFQASGQIRKTAILGICKGHKITPFQFDADGKVIAPRARSPKRYPRMPGSVMAGDKLHYFSVAPYKEMRRDFHATELFVIRVILWIQGVGKKLFNTVPAKLVWRQTDVMNDQ